MTPCVLRQLRGGGWPSGGVSILATHIIILNLYVHIFSGVPPDNIYNDRTFAESYFVSVINKHVIISLYCLPLAFTLLFFKSLFDVVRNSF